MYFITFYKYVIMLTYFSAKMAYLGKLDNHVMFA
jgi:hypothetical protein